MRGQRLVQRLAAPQDRRQQIVRHGAGRWRRIH
jgi:hypothetical protein